MITKKSSGTDGTQPAEESGIKRLYADTARETPPATLDAKILISARQATSKEKNRFPFGSRWGYPLSSAAVIVLSLGVVLLLSQQGVFDPKTPPYSDSDPTTDLGIASRTTAPPATPAAEAPARMKERSLAKTDSAPSDTSRLLMAGKPPAAAMEQREAKESVPETASVSGAMIAQGRMAEERAASPMADTMRAKENTTLNQAKVRVQADVISLQVTGEPGAYQFTVGIRSPDSGCQQYADWWEVVSEEGKLLYRRVLLHSHVNEQPFTRSGGPVPIQSDTIVWVRAHINSAGYGGAAYKGSVKSGFTRVKPSGVFSAELANQPPLPTDCAF
ncbi:MAG: hypothetical protein OEM95_10050 [Gammaproteobacteria bacterium]|nr:hypothetical protein [Gammaproteobacteria bacterium]